ncbi:MAG TPA: hypothetical protein VFS73_08115 [Solirubrobacterales bacterium]|jgi:hypothetical protein|nr:hypothetical protein [Solirubrobacterales bacterium]
MALVLCIAALAAIAAGCGSDDSTSTEAEATAATATSTGATTSTTSDGSDLDAIETTIKTWLTEGDCDLMTDKFLEEQTFNDNPTEACKTFEASFSPPAYSADDIDVTDIEYVNDKATAIVGGGPEGVSITSGGEEVTSKYTLVNEDGTWKIDSAELN